MPNNIKLKFIKECVGLKHKQVTIAPLCHYYKSTITCCDKIGELRVTGDINCDKLQIDVKEGLISDLGIHGGNECWKPSVELSRNSMNGIMEGKWYIRSKDQNKINLIIHETLNEKSNNEKRLFFLELEAPEVENIKVTDQSPLINETNNKSN
jgi:hypothetical protein